MQLQVAFYKGRSRFFNRLVSWWSRGPYSHCELVTAHLNSGALCWSSSFIDGGVRLKVIRLDPEHWDLVDVPATEAQAAAAVAWFKAHEGRPYDVRGLLGLVWRPAEHDKDRWYCNEAIGEALGVGDAWRLDPNGLYSLFTYSAGGFQNATD